METVLSVVSGLFLLAGAFLVFTGGLGLLRFPEFYTRMHAASITDTLATLLIIVGLVLLSDSWLVTAKLVMIPLFILLTSPTAAHALAKAARHGGLAPNLNKGSAD